MITRINCNLCGSDNAKVLFKPELSCGPVVQCRTCKLMYINPRENIEELLYSSDVEKNIENKLSEEDFDKYLQEEKWKRDNFKEAFEEIEQFGGKGQLLDIGCYAGLLLDEARKKGWKVQGIEPDHAAYKYATQKLELKVSFGILHEAKLPENSFDVVTCFQVLEHLDDPMSELKEIYRILKKGGLLVLEVPNIDCLISKIMGKYCRHFAKHHYYFFSKSTLEQMLGKAGFKAEKISFPSRKMSFKHLNVFIEKWNIRASHVFLRFLNILKIKDYTININMHDIIKIYAKK